MKKILVLVAIAALAVPAAAAAKTIEVKGPQVVGGRGFVRGELKMAATDARPVGLRFRGGYVRLIDLDDDLEVRCATSREPRKSKNAKGQTVLMCIGGAMARGSHFQLSGFSMRFLILSPEGTTGSITGNVVTREAGEQGRDKESEQGKGKGKAKGDEPAKGEESDADDAEADESDAVGEIQTALAAQGK